MDTSHSSSLPVLPYFLLHLQRMTLNLQLRRLSAEIRAMPSIE
jgi:hypothetical protein